MAVPVDWNFTCDIIKLEGVSKPQISIEDAERQTETAKSIIADLRARPGVLLADEVGMGKTYVAMAVIASVVVATRRAHCPVVVMVPAGLRQKWQRDWEQFKTRCIRNHKLDWVRDVYAHTPTDFFKLLDDRVEKRAHIIFITTGCFSRGLNDPWVKLAMIRLARSHTKLTDKQKRCLYRWAPDLVRQFSNYKLTEDVVRQLMNADVLDWKRILVAKGILADDADDPVPDRLQKEAYRIDWTSVNELLRELPGWRPSSVSKAKRNEMRQRFGGACRMAYEHWLNLARWTSPLLVLDEAHHAKNDSTRLAKLFRKESEDDVALLHNKFDRMLFLSATPFQLGHQELIRVLRSFTAVRWSPPKKAPEGTREDFTTKMTALEQALDANRLAARHFDRLWGKLRSEVIVQNRNDKSQSVIEWWRTLEISPGNPWEQNLVQAYRDCADTRDQAERLLKPWLIRHNRSSYLPGTMDVQRRCMLLGNTISAPTSYSSSHKVEGIPIESDMLLPFLITARAQGQLAQCAHTRAFFAEGLASSYEAFHHTRDVRLHAKDFDDGLDIDTNGASWMVPTKWYEEQIARLIPSRNAPRVNRMLHPKISATVKRTIDLWLSGEKVLIFCFYIQTAHALNEHIRDEVNHRIIKTAGDKLGLDSQQSEEIKRQLARIIRRLSDSESILYQEMRSRLENALKLKQYDILKNYREKLLKVLMAYFRSPSFVVRYFLRTDQLIHDALEYRESSKEVIARSVGALFEETDASNQTYLARVGQFLDFAGELAERAERRLALKKGESSDESENPLQEYLDAVSIYSKPRRMGHEDKDEMDDEVDDGSYRVMPLVRMVYGDTKTEIRDRLMLAFNSPLFPEILVSSSVMGEGVDLHRFCRHVIHHDLCWNPSTLEQRTGRLDRVRCKAEVCKLPIEVYEPFLAGSADEKMFRVLRDRESWFQIVMGQKFEFDEATSEEYSSRLPLPSELSEILKFKLARWPVSKSELNESI
jgi:superfamily II DNA or RNA helicase